MLTTRVSFQYFKDSFSHLGCEKNFSYEALEVLYAFYDEGEDTDLDVIEICESWTEIKKKDEIKELYDVPKDEDPLQWLVAKTSVLLTECNTFIIFNF